MKVRLDEFCNIYKGKTTITKAIPGEYPLVVTAENRASHNEYQFDCKAVCVPLVSATGHGHASIKRLHYQEGKFALGTILSAVIPKDENILDTRYLYIYLSYFKDSVLVPLMRGSSNVSLTIKSLGSAEIELLPIEKQKSIVELVTRIEKNKFEVDQKLEEQTKIISLLRNEILSLAVKGKLVLQDDSDETASVLIEKIREEKDRLVKERKIKKEKALPEISEDEITYELPKGWELVRFKDITICRDGERIPVSKEDREKREKIYDYYGASGIIDKIDNYIFDKNLLLIGEDGANLITRSKPIAFIAEGKYWVNNHAHVMDSVDEITLRYLAIYINSIDLKPYVTGTAQPKMNQAKLNSIPVIVPPLNEQKRIVDKVDKLMKVCNELELRIEESKKYNEKLMEWILKESFKA